MVASALRSSYDLNRYQVDATEFLAFEHLGKRNLWSVVYTALGLAGEAGEVADKTAKLLRDHDGIISEELRDAILMELGDTLWYLAALCDELNADLNTVAKLNISKLLDRRNRSTVHGNGDDR